MDVEVRKTSQSSSGLPSRLPMLCEVGIVLCVGAIAFSRMVDSRFIPAFNAFLMLLVTLGAAGASFRRPKPPQCFRTALRARHRDGIAVGTICVPAVCATLMLSDAVTVAYMPSFWIASCCSLVTSLRLLTPSAREVGGMSAAISSSCGWAVIMGVALGPWTLGVVPTAAIVLAFDVFGAVLAPILTLSAGEMCVIGEGFLILSDAAVRLAYQAIMSPLDVPIEDDSVIISRIIVILMSGTCLAALALLPVFRVYARKNFDESTIHDASCPTCRPVEDTSCLVNGPRMGVVTIVYVHVVLFSVMAFLESPWLFRVLGRNPWTWAGTFLTARPSRLAWAAYWVVLLGTVTQFAPSSASSRVPNIVIRKYFHGVAVVMFAPVIIFDLQLMRAAFVVAIMGLLFAEFLRVIRLPVSGVAVHRYMSQYIDARDKGYVTLTHLYLLLGCAIATWLPLQTSSTLPEVVSLSGVLILGVGDAAAACVGTYMGRSKWPGTKKSLEGTAAGFVSVIGAVWALHSLSLVSGIASHIVYITTFEVIQLSAASACACLLETFTTQVDNLVLPLYFFVALVLLSPKPE